MKPYDPWTLSGGKEPYSVDKVYKSYKDGQGHYDKLSLKIDEGLLAEINALIASGKMPEYRSTHDFIRDAMHHRMEYLRGVVNDPKFDRFVEAERRRAELLRIQREIQEQYDDLNTIREQLTISSSRADADGVNDLLDWLEGELDSFRGPYREQAEGLLRSYHRAVRPQAD